MSDIDEEMKSENLKLEKFIEEIIHEKPEIVGIKKHYAEEYLQLFQNGMMKKKEALVMIQS